MAKETKLGLVEALNAATADDLAGVRQQMASLEVELSSLRMIERVLACKIEGKRPGPKSAKPGPRPASASQATAAANGQPGSRDRQRRDAARFLAESGPQRRAAIMEACGIPPGSITAVLDCGWFRANPDGTISLTASGETSALTMKSAS